jgi:hypothetical protein
MDAAVSIAIRQWRIDGVCRRQTPIPKSGRDAGFWNAQGIEAVSFFAAGKKDTSAKPGFRREAPEMRPIFPKKNS